MKPRGPSSRALFYGITAAIVVWVEIWAALADNGVLFLFGFFAALVWVWGVDVFSKRWSESYRYERDRERLP